jgi:hypothetical protein
MRAAVRSRSPPFAQTSCLQRFRLSERTRANANEHRTLPFLPRIKAPAPPGELGATTPSSRAITEGSIFQTPQKCQVLRTRRRDLFIRRRAGRFAREKTPKIGTAAGAASRMGGSARRSGPPRASVIPANDHLPLDAWQGSDSASCRGASGKLSAAAQIDERLEAAVPRRDECSLKPVTDQRTTIGMQVCVAAKLL